MFDDIFDQLLGEGADPVAAGWRLRDLATQAADRGPQLLDELAGKYQSLGESDPAIVGGVLRVLHTVWLQAGPSVLGKIDPALVMRIDSALPIQAPNRHLLLHLLAMGRSDDSLAVLVQLLRESPPATWVEAAQVLSPLMQHDDWPVDAIYPQVLDALEHASLASPLLDLANYLYRGRRVPQHPAVERLAMLNHLLGEVTNRLARFEENPHVFGDDVETVQARLGEAVALAVSLCDALGLIGDPSAIGKLNQTVQLKHRRVQCEAAGALARLGDEGGRQRLLELTADPAARLRAIHYADELGFGATVDEQYRSEQSVAEAEMSLWLSQPQQMGVPPTGIEVIDSRRMMWPSFQNPIDVFLVRFEYSFGERVYSNVGVTGPVTFAMSTDVADLPVGDIYAMYAGWHAEHSDIFTVAADQLNEAQVRLMHSFRKTLEEAGYESLQPGLLGVFLDEMAGVFTAKRDGTECVVVTDNLETIDRPTSGRLRPMSPADVFNLYKGRKMLRTFNPNS